MAVIAKPQVAGLPAESLSSAQGRRPASPPPRLPPASSCFLPTLLTLPCFVNLRNQEGQALLGRVMQAHLRSS